MLDAHRLMCLATLRPDGWPQNTMVGYVNQATTLYFVVSRTSQKLANIQHDPRVSIAIGTGGDQSPRRGLSMAAHAAEIVDLAEIRHLNDLIHSRYPEASLFAPPASSVAVMRATPAIVSLIEMRDGKLYSDLVRIDAAPGGA
ncbi:pyridoxamine 5'-phosphate oxidase [Caulobacter sp. CCUG 60055]|uniref:pyridoxamine 5'-phosphate oxidase family protein n=1 Tax=Caulobacter sp. CCUG 60055 TaxID=2100090 RepID=UPI001FA77801|nr:pyridoxamine 5'-phosphate oxidase family protein [Caulobacter sp. CCUG 60055]MCI3179247.1 pyridoxamine 5'-phosphate oxidase [Caulobacter sp. CCUG 60055]